MRVVLTTTGTHGDINPLIFVGKALKARGHVVTVATALMFEPEIAAAGLNFHPVRPHFLPEALMRPTSDPEGLPARMMREAFFACVRGSFEDLREPAANSDLMVSHMLAFAAPLVAEVMGVRWLSVV